MVKKLKMNESLQAKEFQLSFQMSLNVTVFFNVYLDLQFAMEIMIALINQMNPTALESRLI